MCSLCTILVFTSVYVICVALTLYYIFDLYYCSFFFFFFMFLFFFFFFLLVYIFFFFFFFSSRRRHTRCSRDWRSDVCSSDLINLAAPLESEVQPLITLRDVAISAAHLVDLRQIARYNFHLRTYPAAIALHADSLDEDRVVYVSAIVAQHLGWTIEIANHKIDVAIVIDVAESDSATRTLLGQNSAKLGRHFGERTVAIVSMQQARLTIIWKLRIHVPVGHEKIHPTIVVVIKKPCAPTDVRHTGRRHLRSVGKVRKRIRAVVPIQRVVLVGEVGNEKIDFTVVIIISGSHSHASLLAAVLIHRGAGVESDLLERAVAFVSVVEVRRRVVSDKDVDLTVVVEVAGDYAEAIEPVRISDAGLFRNVGKRPVAIVSEERITSAF